MSKQEYFKISQELNLPNRCPILGYCDRHAWTLYLFSQYDEVDYDRDFIKTLQKEGVLALDYNNKRTKLRSEEPGILRGPKYGHFSNMCPEVNLFDKDNSFGNFGGIACTDGSWDYEINSNSKVNITEIKHFSECLEFSNSKYAKNQGSTEDDFIDREFDEISINELGFDNKVSEVISLRIEEIKRCLSNNAPLSVIFLSGSALEGMLLGFATKYPKEFNQSVAAPKDKDGKVKSFYDWSLSNFIDVSHDIGLLNENIKKFSHVLREFRNFIHPFEQISKEFNPDLHTAKLCWQVLKVAIIQLSENKLE